MMLPRLYLDRELAKATRRLEDFLHRQEVERTSGIQFAISPSDEFLARYPLSIAAHSAVNNFQNHGLVPEEIHRIELSLEGNGLAGIVADIS